MQKLKNQRGDNLKKKIQLIITVVTLMSIVLFAQSALGAGYYLINGQRGDLTQNTGTYTSYFSINGSKIKLPVTPSKENTWTGIQKIYYVYPSASQGSNYIPVFKNRITGNGWTIIEQPEAQQPEPEQPPVQPQPEPEQPPAQPQPEPEPEQPPVQPQPEPEQPKEPGAYQLTADEQKLVNLINSERTKAGLNPLAIDYNLSRVARIKSEDMRTNNYFSHTSPTYGSPFQMMKDFGISYRSAAENIARTSSVDRAHTGFMNSEGHRKNILTPGFTHIGVGISGNYYTEMFISK